jgi:4-amino-4-deoxy-L-arabinose transferase-like glycosyltransferase
VRSIFVVPVAIGAITLIVASVVLYRRKLLSARYFVGWIAVGASLGIGALVLALVHQKVGSDALTAIAVSVGLVALLGLLVQLSISVSGLQRQLRQVAQAVALLSTTSHPGQDATDPTSDGLSL